MSDKVREQFDAWWSKEYESHTYQHADAYNMAWEGWLAGRRDALLDAARACAVVAMEEDNNHYSNAGGALARVCEERIMSLTQGDCR